MAKESAKRPFYKKKRWWVVLVVAMTIFYFIGVSIENAEDEKAEKTKQERLAKKEKQKEEKEQKKDERKDEDEQNERAEQEETKEEPEEQTIKVDENFEVDKLTIEVQSVKVEDGRIIVPFWWSHWASNDKVHFEALAYVVAKQDGEELELTEGHDSVLRQKAKGIDDRAELAFDLIDIETPVDITFKSTSENGEEEMVKVDIK